MPFRDATHRAAMLILAILGWFALVAQSAFSVRRALENGGSVASGLIDYFSYFTIITNVMVASAYTARALAPASRPGRFFARPTVGTAILVYIIVVGVVYALLLRQLWNPVGLERIADRLLHYVVPIGSLLLWSTWRSRGRLRWIDALPWLAYPAVYFCYSMVRGMVQGRYPYPFVDVATLGYGRVFANGLGLLALFLVLGLGFIAIDRLIARRVGAQLRAPVAQ